MLVGLETQDFQRRWCDGCDGRPPIDHGMARRPRRAAEMQAQGAMTRVMRGKRLVVLEPMYDICGAREQQRQQRDERYQAVVAKNANAGQWGRNGTHGLCESIGWPVPGQLKDNHLTMNCLLIRPSR